MDNKRKGYREEIDEDGGNNKDKKYVKVRRKGKEKVWGKGDNCHIKALQPRERTMIMT